MCVRYSQFPQGGILFFVHGAVHALFACADIHLYDLLGLSSSFDWPTLFYHKKIRKLTLCVLVSSAENFHKQFGARSGPANCRA